MAVGVQSGYPGGGTPAGRSPHADLAFALAMCLTACSLYNRVVVCRSAVCPGIGFVGGPLLLLHLRKLGALKSKLRPLPVDGVILGH